MKTSMNIAAPQTTSSGPRCLSGGIVTPEDPARALHEHAAVVLQVGGEEDDDRDLAQLGRLEGDRPDAHAEVGAVDLLADPGHAREQQQREARRTRSCSGSAPARGSRAAGRSSARTRSGRSRTTAPARARGPRRCGRSTTSPKHARTATSGNRYGSAYGSVKRITRCATKHSARKTAPYVSETFERTSSRWMKIAANPAVTSSDAGISAISSRLRADIVRRCGLLRGLSQAPRRRPWIAACGR